MIAKSHDFFGSRGKPCSSSSSSMYTYPGALSRSCVYTLGSKVAAIFILGALEIYIYIYIYICMYICIYILLCRWILAAHGIVVGLGYRLGLRCWPKDELLPRPGG